MRRATDRVRMVAIAAAATVALAAAAAVFAGLRPADSGVAAVPPPALAASAVPYLPSTVSVLSAKQLAADASIPALSGTLSRLGFAVGTQRVFQGPSKH
ncbi:MAG: hypothetical protein ACXVY5_02230, partial [Gaiellales bacterium]